jgi:hypothetical protein
MVGMIPTMVMLMYALPESCNPSHSAVLGRDVSSDAGWRRHRLSDQFVDGPPRHQARDDVRTTKSGSRDSRIEDAEHGNADASVRWHAQATAISLARQARIIALTLAALAVAVWLTAHFAPIRL